MTVMPDPEAAARERRRRGLRRYVLLQLPGGFLAALGLAGLVHFTSLSVPAACVLFALWVLKDVAMYPLVARAYEPDGEVDRLLGASGVVTAAVDPEGWVRVGPELWRAVRPPGTPAIPCGAPVRVRERRQLTLVVERESPVAEPLSGAEAAPPAAPRSPR